MTRSKTLPALAAVACLVMLAAAAVRLSAAKAAAAMGAGPLAAEAQIRGAEPGLNGKVTFMQNGAQVHVIADVSGATPGQHGFHIHEKGVCTPPDFKSAGGHFNPNGSPHACMPSMPRHPGDFGNITVGADGKGHLDATVDTITLSGATSIVGKAVVFHKGTDDCTTQPTGNAGDRAGCGVIEAAAH
jgi:superoxide dismutase, Cu-Zn family